jgi:hypothetical protein
VVAAVSLANPRSRDCRGPCKGDARVRLGRATAVGAGRVLRLGDKRAAAAAGAQADDACGDAEASGWPAMRRAPTQLRSRHHRRIPLLRGRTTDFAAFAASSSSSPSCSSLWSCAWLEAVIATPRSLRPSMAYPLFVRYWDGGAPGSRTVERSRVRQPLPWLGTVGRSGDQDELAPDMTVLADAVCLVGARERERLHLDHQFVLGQ